MKNRKKHMVFPSEKFTGKIIISTRKIPVSLTANAGCSGKLKIEVDPIQYTDSHFELVKSMSKVGDLLNYFKLECKSEGGRQLKSDTAYLTAHSNSWRTGEDAVLQIGLDAQEVSLTTKMQKLHKAPVVVLSLLNFNCFGVVVSETKLGKVSICGGAGKMKTSNKITGTIRIESLNEDNSADWKDNAQTLLKRLRSVLAFVRGVPLSSPAEEFYNGNHHEAIFHNINREEGQSEFLACIHHLSLDSFFEKIAPVVCGIKDAEWNLLGTMINLSIIPTNYWEIRFLTQMIALESFAIGYLKLEKPEKIPLSDKIISLLNKLKINREKIDDKDVKNLTDTRNLIAHRGIAKEDNDLWLSIITAREILVRVVFSMLEFEGVYDCYIDGRHSRKFPECSVV